MAEHIPKSSRRFTKMFVIVNLVLIWLLMFASVIFAQAEYVVVGGFALIGTLFSLYTGIGHMDYRKSVDLVKATKEVDGETG